MAHADPEARKAYLKAYYEANRDRIMAKDKAYYEANRESRLAQRKAYREANREELRARNKAWREANREKDLARVKKNRTKRKRLKIEGPIDDGITAASVAERDGFVCRECGTKVVKHPGGYLANGWTIGHIEPLSKGGTHTWDNVQCECHECNTAKGNR